MPIDTGLINQLRPIRVPNQTNALMQALQAQGLVRQDEAAQMDLEQRKRENALSQAYSEAMRSGANLDDPGTVQRLTQVDPMRTQALLKAHLDTKNKQSEIAERENKGRLAQAEENRKRFGQSLQMLSMVDTPETLMAWAQQSELPAPLMQGLAAQLQANPGAFGDIKKRMLMMGMDAAKQMEMMTPKFQTVNTGKQTLFVDTNAHTNPKPQPLVMTTTPGEDMTDARQRSEGAANRAQSERSSLRADARARELNQITKELGITEKELRIGELRDKQEDRQRSKSAARASVENQIAVIDKALAHPGRKTATGLSGTIDPRNYVPGTDAADFRAVLDQIGGAAFLQAFESLKGGGQITEVEGKKATDAMARLSRAQSDAEFEKSLKDLRKVMQDGANRLGAKTESVSRPQSNKPSVSNW